MAQLKLLELIFAYLPAGLFVLLAALSSYFPTLLDALSQQYVLVLIGLALLSVGFRLESMFRAQVTRMDELESTTKRLAEVQERFLEHSRSAVAPSTLADGFRNQAAAGRRIGVVRVFAISSQQVLSFFKAEGLEAGTCYLLVRAFGPHASDHAEFKNQIMLAVRDWRRLAVEGKIKQLKIGSYDFFPTEYQVIFDDVRMLTGLYDSDPSDYSEVRVRQPFRVEGSSADGRAMIQAYSERFDNLFEQCRSHHGHSPYEEYQHPSEAGPGSQSHS